MTSKRVFILVHDTARQRAIDEVRNAPDGYVVEVKETTRTLEQNALMWPLLTDISKQVKWYGNVLSPEEYKDLLSAGLIKSKVVPNIENNGFVVLGQHTSEMSKRVFSELCELILAFGSEHGVRWSKRKEAA